MSKDVFNFLYCEVCGEKVSKLQSHDLTGHEKCIKSVREDIKILKLIALEIESQWPKEAALNLSTLNLHIKKKIRILKKQGKIQ